MSARQITKRILVLLVLMSVIVPFIGYGYVQAKMIDAESVKAVLLAHPSRASDQCRQSCAGYEICQPCKQKPGNLLPQDAADQPAIVMGSRVLSLPVVQDNLAGGRLVIREGLRLVNEADRLARCAGEGVPPVPLDMATVLRI